MQSQQQYYVYIMANWNNRVVYIGVTNNLIRRVLEHRQHLNQGFTDKYNVTKLVYYTGDRYILNAIAYEKQIKKWRREKKDQLIRSMNPQWLDLFPDLIA